MRSLALLLIGIGILFPLGLRADPAGDLLRGSSEGNIAQMKRAVAAGADVNSRQFYDSERCSTPALNREEDCNKRTALMLASAGGHGVIVEYLLSLKARPELRGGQGRDALSLAARGGHFEIVKRLHAAAAPVRGCQSMALLEAAFSKELEIAEYLLSVGADTDCKFGIIGDFPLSAAAHAGTPAVVRLLLENGADANMLNADQMTALFIATKRHYYRPADLRAASMATIIALLKGGANPNRGVPGYGGPLMLAAYDGEIELLRLLIRYGADVNAPYANKSLLEEIRTGTGVLNREAVVNLLIGAGAE